TGLRRLAGGGVRIVVQEAALAEGVAGAYGVQDLGPAVLALEDLDLATQDDAEAAPRLALMEDVGVRRMLGDLRQRGHVLQLFGRERPGQDMVAERVQNVRIHRADPGLCNSATRRRAGLGLICESVRQRSTSPSSMN